jgi:hypothetical protein
MGAGAARQRGDGCPPPGYGGQPAAGLPGGRDLLRAIDHEPGGRQHGYTSGVRSPAGWIRSRLAAWSGPDEVPLPSRSQRLAEARRQVLAEQTARRARGWPARYGRSVSSCRQTWA